MILLLQQTKITNISSSILEFKCLSVLDYLNNISILVAPYWNLNLRVYKWDNVDTNDISSSILEFKYRRRFIKEIWDKILVAPYWNLNLFPTLKTPLYSIPY